MACGQSSFVRRTKSVTSENPHSSQTGLEWATGQRPTKNFVIPTRERSETGGTCFLPGNMKRCGYPSRTATQAPPALSSRAEHERPKDGHAQSKGTTCPSIFSSSSTGNPLRSRPSAVQRCRAPRRSDHATAQIPATKSRQGRQTLAPDASPG